MKQYCGRFPVNKGLTKKLGYEDFVVYRDPEVGLYAYSEKRELDVNLMTWNETIKSFTEDTRSFWAGIITEAIEDEPTAYTTCGMRY